MFQWRLRQKNKSPSNLYESESVIHTDSIFAQQTHRYRVLHTHVSSKLFDSLQLMTYILFSQHYFFSHVLMVVLSGTMLCNMSLAPSPTVCMSIIASVTHSINLTLRIITALQYWASREQGRDWENKDKTKDRISHFSHFWEAVLFIKSMHIHKCMCIISHVDTKYYFAQHTDAQMHTQSPCVDFGRCRLLCWERRLEACLCCMFMEIQTKLSQLWVHAHVHVCMHAHVHAHMHAFLCEAICL